MSSRIVRVLELVKSLDCQHHHPAGTTRTEKGKDCNRCLAVELLEAWLKEHHGTFHFSVDDKIDLSDLEADLADFVISPDRTNEILKYFREKLK